MPENSITVSYCGNINAQITVPGDKSISHRAAIISSLSEGKSKLSNYLMSEDCLNTIKAFRDLGVSIQQTGDREFLVEGKGINGLSKPSVELDMGNSGTGMRLVAGVLASQGFNSVIVGDESLSQRPMKRIIAPLELMGAKIKARDNNYPPLEIEGHQLNGIMYELPVPSAQVKSAILLASLNVSGQTTIIEKIKSRDHTELMLKYFGADIKVESDKIILNGSKKLTAKDVVIPSDISSAAFFMVAASAMRGAKLRIKDVGLNSTRTAIIDILKRMGANISIEQSDKAVEGWGEPRGDIFIQGSTLRGTTIQGAEVPIVIDEIPILSVAASLAEGTTVIKDAKELRVKESDRIKTMVTNLTAVGVDVTELEDGMLINGGRQLTSATVDSFGDHRIAMSMAIMGLFIKDGATRILNTKNIDTSFPDFEKILKEMIK